MYTQGSSLIRTDPAILIILDLTIEENAKPRSRSISEKKSPVRQDANWLPAPNGPLSRHRLYWRREDAFLLPPGEGTGTAGIVKGSECTGLITYENQPHLLTALGSTLTRTTRSHW